MYYKIQIGLAYILSVEKRDGHLSVTGTWDVNSASLYTEHEAYCIINLIKDNFHAYEVDKMKAS